VEVSLTARFCDGFMVSPVGVWMESDVCYVFSLNKNLVVFIDPVVFHDQESRGWSDVGLENLQGLFEDHCDFD